MRPPCFSMRHCKHPVEWSTCQERLDVEAESSLEACKSKPRRYSIPPGETGEGGSIASFRVKNTTSLTVFCRFSFGFGVWCLANTHAATEHTGGYVRKQFPSRTFPVDQEGGLPFCRLTVWEYRSSGCTVSLFRWFCSVYLITCFQSNHCQILV